MGDWDDNIHLSTRTAEFSASGDSVTIKTEGSWWWIDDISIDGNYYHDFRNINQQADSYSMKQDCIDVRRLDRNTLFVKVDANTLTSKRIISVGLEAGDYFDRVTITQKSK